MKRDLALVREILKALADAKYPLDASLFVDDRHDFQDVAYHFRIMEQGGLIKASIQYADNSVYCAKAESMTWEGNDFLDSVRDEKIWKKVLRKVSSVTESASFSVVKSLAVMELEKILLA